MKIILLSIFTLLFFSGCFSSKNLSTFKPPHIKKDKVNIYFVNKHSGPDDLSHKIIIDGKNLKEPIVQTIYFNQYAYFSLEKGYYTFQVKNDFENKPVFFGIEKKKEGYVQKPLFGARDNKNYLYQYMEKGTYYMKADTTYDVKAIVKTFFALVPTMELFDPDIKPVFISEEEGKETLFDIIDFSPAFGLSRPYPAKAN